MDVFVIRAGALGDSVLTLPLIRSINRELPGRKISVIGSYPMCALVKNSPSADFVYSIEEPSFSSFFTGGSLSPFWVRRLEKAEFVFDLIEDEVLLKNLKRVCPGRVFAVSGIGAGGHAADTILSVLAGAGIESEAFIPEVYIPQEDKDFAADFFKSKNLPGEKTAVIHPGSGSKKKNWPAEKFAAVARKLIEDLEMKIILSEGEADEAAAEGFMKHFREDEIVSVKNLPLKKLAAILEKCRLYTGNDSGVSHLAAAAGAPCVCVFGPTDPGIWSPRGGKSKGNFQ